MELDKDFIQEILTPLKKNISLTPLEYYNALIEQGTAVENEVIDKKFHRHLEYAVEKGMITNSRGEATLKACGFVLCGNGAMTIIDGNNFLKEGAPMSNDTENSVTNFHIQGDFSGNLLSGNNSTINNVTIQHLVKELEKSKDPAAKKILDNIGAIVAHPIVQGILQNV